MSFALWNASHPAKDSSGKPHAPRMGLKWKPGGPETSGPCRQKICRTVVTSKHWHCQGLIQNTIFAGKNGFDVNRFYGGVPQF